MRAGGSKSGVKNKTPKSPGTREYLGKIGIFLLLNSIFLTQNSIFFNGFPISEKSENIFFNGFPLSSTAFHFLINMKKSIYGGKTTKDHYLSFVFPATCSVARLQRQYASTPVCQYTSTPLCQYAITPVRQYAITPVCQPTIAN
jgi:hypothetical protein